MNGRRLPHNSDHTLSLNIQIHIRIRQHTTHQQRHSYLSLLTDLGACMDHSLACSHVRTMHFNMS